MSLRRLVAISVLCVVLASFMVMWFAFAEMWRTGTPVVRLVANRYGEFKLEAAMYALGMLLLPVAVYELDQMFREG
jgi:hypothetical protein